MAVILSPLAVVGAELTTEERLAERGLTVLALQNDTITNQDGDIDAVRVVVVLNSTAAQNELIVKLRGLHEARSFGGAGSFVCWADQHHARVRCMVKRRTRFDWISLMMTGFVASFGLPTFVLTPAPRSRWFVLS